MSDQESRRPLIMGMINISKWYNLPRMKAARLAAQGELPGVFRLGRQFALDETVAGEEITARARGQRTAA